MCLSYLIVPSLSPFLLNPKLVKLAKRLKKEKVNVDIINFGEEVRVFSYLTQYCRLTKYTCLECGISISSPVTNDVLTCICLFLLFYRK